MRKLPEICHECANKEDCKYQCAAFSYLETIYQEQRTKEKRQLIHRLRKLIDIVDAEPSEEMTKLAQQIIKKVPEMQYIKDYGIKVGYVMSYERKTGGGKATLGQCQKITGAHTAYLPFDFVITFYEPNIAHLTENQLKILMWHELKHIGIGDRGLIIVPHDIEDFLEITDQHSTRWGELGAEVADILGDA